MKESILIVDDQLANIQLAASLLAHLEYEIHHAPSAKDAFKILKTENIDLLLLDFNMPDMDGFETCLHLREEGYTLPIIFLTANDDPESIVQAFESGGNDYVLKPFKSFELIARVENQLSLKRMRDKLTLDIKTEVAKKMEMEHLLVEQTKMAQVGEMFSMITHQWRQPLSAITLACTKAEVQMDLENYSQDSCRETLHDITKYASHLSNTIEDFKSFFKPTKNFKIFSLLGIVKKALSLNHERFSFAEVTVKLDERVHLQVRTIENELIQVLLTLFQNSLDAFEANEIKHPHLSIMFRELDGEIEMIIQDNAGGIQLDDLDQIFEANVSTKGSKGSGMGLYMCRLMIENHCHGSISVENEGVGARFSIVLPTKL
jgi:DNA-binding response OmpR family regulator